MSNNNLDYAVVVGVTHYMDNIALKGPAKDATEIYNWLLRSDGGNIPLENCHLIISNNDPWVPIQDTIDEYFLDIIRNIRKSNEKGRRLYFYFSGHGFGIDWNNTALVLPKWTHDNRNHALSSAAYGEALVHLGHFEEVFFFFDCCRDRSVGITGAEPSFRGPRVSDNAANCSHFVFSATKFSNPAYEAVIQNPRGSFKDEDRTRGLFTTSLLNGLNGGAALNNGSITANSLAVFLQRDLPVLSQQNNKGVQMPQTIGLVGKDIVIVDNIKVVHITLEIIFRKHGMQVVLENSDAVEIDSFESDTGQNRQIQLSKGIYAIYYVDEKEQEKFIRIDGKNNKLIYEL